MSRLDRAIVWPADINEYDSQFEFIQVNPATLFVSLYDLFVARGGAGLFPTFTYYTETGMGAWPAGNININLTVGQSLLDGTRRMMALSNFDMIARYDGSLDAYNYLGSDLSSSVVFRYGRHILSAKKKQAGAEIANVVLGEGSGTYLQTLDAGSVTTYGRRETHLPLRITDDLTYALLVNNVLLSQYADAPTSVDLSAVCTTYVPGVHYNVGDTVGVAIEDRLNGTYRCSPTRSKTVPMGRVICEWRWS